MSASNITREQFISRMRDSERGIRHRVVPLGIIYSIRLVSAFAGLVLSVLLFWFLATEARNTVLIELGVCILLFVGSYAAEWDGKRRFVRLALKCPSCQSCLVFLRTDQAAQKTLETGRCYHCGERVFTP